MSRVKRCWKVREPPVELRLALTSNGLLEVRFECPHCEEPHAWRVYNECQSVRCECGLHMMVTLWPFLEELEVEEVKGE